MRGIYTLSIRIYGFLLWMAAPWNKKARQWTEGRSDWQGKLKRDIEHPEFAAANPVWFHVSSLGEFEQGRPVMEAIRRRWPERRIVLTFFSPSGYEIRKNYDGADMVGYLPADTPGNAARFLDIVRPGMVFFVKYDFWFNYLDAIHRRGIPLFYLSALFRPGQHFFRWYGGWFRRHLRMVSHYFVQNEESAALLRQIGIAGVTVTGDTRFDRVFAIAVAPKSLPAVEHFCDGRPVLVLGSTWEPDEEACRDLIRRAGDGLKIILAPHDPSPARIRSLQERTAGMAVVQLSELTDDNARGASLLLVDSVGLLSQLYRFATVAYIGGGFGHGIHNIQEPVTFGVPVLFGPNHRKFREARDLAALGGAFPVVTREEVTATGLHLIGDSGARERASAVCIKYVEENRGATEKVMRYLETSGGIV